MSSQLMILCVILLLAIVVSVVLSVPQNDCTTMAEWQEFKTSFNKQYESQQEESRRCQLWYEVYNDVNQHNSDKTQTYTKAVYHFADWTSDEHKKFRMGYSGGENPFSDVAIETRDFPIVSALPSSVDWIAKGAVTSVKNQGSCGSCWTFSATGVLEGAYKIKKGSLFSFSEQQILDCNTSGQYGCDGGWPAKALTYVNKTGGINLGSDYSYKSVKATKCNYNSAKAKKFKIKSVVKVGDKDAQIQTALAYQGPLSVCVCASPSSFSYYSSGVYSGVNCSVNTADHAVLAVGYVKTSSTCYYVIKNSWGGSWGKNGYINIACNTAKKLQVVDNYYVVLA